MTRYGSDSSLWPQRSAGPKRMLSLKRLVHICIGLAVFLIAAHSLADLVALPPADAGGMPDVAGGGVCRRDSPYIQSGCPAAGRTAGGALAEANRPVRIVTDDRAATLAPSPAAPPRSQDANLSRAATTDGAGRHDEAAFTALVQHASAPPVAQPTPATVPAPATQLAPAARPATSPAAAAPATLSERELTFKQGYALRQAALGRPGAAAAAPQKVVQSKPKPHKQRAPVQVYALPDGRTVVVRRQYGSAPVDARAHAGGFRSAGIGPERFGQGFGEPFGARRGWFSQGGGPRGLN